VLTEAGGMAEAKQLVTFEIEAALNVMPPNDDLCLILN
jgi:hypothetical protein